MSRRLAFLGPPGTFSEEAALRYDSQAQLMPFVSISAAAAAIDSGTADEGVVPIENSLEGSVPETLDILIHDSRLSVRDEIVLPIEHLLLARRGTKPSDVKVISSVPQALAQCRGYIERQFPKAALEAALSTAAAGGERVGREYAKASDVLLSPVGWGSSWAWTTNTGGVAARALRPTGTR